MAKALIFLATGYEEVEMLTVVDMLRRAGIDIDMVSVTKDPEVTGSHNITIKADVLFEDADLDQAQALILPGGIPGTPNLKAYTPLCEALKTFAKEGKLVAAVCAAPTVLSELGILKDKKATSYPSFEGKLDCAEYLQQPYVVDGNVITSRGMGTCIEFAGAIIGALKDDETAKQVKDAIVYQG